MVYVPWSTAHLIQLKLISCISQEKSQSFGHQNLSEILLLVHKMRGSLLCLHTTGKSTQVFVLFYFVLFILSYLIRRLTNPTDEGSSFPISWLLKDPSSNTTTLKLEFQYVSSGYKYLVGNGKRVNCPKFLIEVKLEEVFKLTDNDFRCLKPSVMNWTEAYWKAPKPIVALLP